MEKDMYTLKLNEKMDIGNSTYVRRVPGGWIYTKTFFSESVHQIFVPYSDKPIFTNRQRMNKR